MLYTYRITQQYPLVKIFISAKLLKNNSMLNDLFSPLIDLVIDVFTFWDKSDSKRISMIKNARDKVLSEHDDVLVDSNKSYLLLNTEKGLYLISRRDVWKAKLGAREEIMYARKGARSFSRIRRDLK